MAEGLLKPRWTFKTEVEKEVLFVFAFIKDDAAIHTNALHMLSLLLSFFLIGRMTMTSWSYHGLLGSFVIVIS